MKKMLFILLVPFLVASCSAQNEKTTNEKENLSSEQKSTEPKVDVKVNKVYDENGNLISYDSTYVWSYTNTFGDSVDVNIDSVMSQFKPMIGSHFPGFLNDNYNDYFFGDSLFYHDFLSPDYFFDRWEQERIRMNRMMREMDSLKELFFREQYPELKKDNSGTKTL